jgi:hypothetical protein
MRRHRTIISTVVLLAALTAPTADASPLLSGYGGPGQGNQAILGSALLNGPRGGGGSGSGGSGSGGSQGGSQGGGSAAAGGGAASTPSRAGGSRASAGEGGGSGRAGGRAAALAAASAAARAQAAPFSFYPASERAASARSTGVLGLSGEDALYILLGFAALLFTGLATRRITARPPGTGRQLKG